MPHLHAWVCGGDLAALPMALGWWQGREAGTHSCWRGNEPSVALTCVSACWGSCGIAMPVPHPFHSQSQMCCLDTVQHAGGCGGGMKGSASGWAAQEQGEYNRIG